MTRIVGGSAGGRRLSVPTGRGTRPTSDRTREALFSTLQTLRPLLGARVLDLYAGSGAVGLEALSRGAGHALFVESAAAALRALRANVAALGLPGAEVRAGTVEQVLRCAPTAPYDVVFADPPYATANAVVTSVLTRLLAGGWVGAGAVVVVERSKRDEEPQWPVGIEPVSGRRYGEAALWYGRAAPAA